MYLKSIPMKDFFVKISNSLSVFCRLRKKIYAQTILTQLPVYIDSLNLRGRVFGTSENGILLILEYDFFWGSGWTNLWNKNISCICSFVHFCAVISILQCLKQIRVSSEMRNILYFLRKTENGNLQSSTFVKIDQRSRLVDLGGMLCSSTQTINFIFTDSHTCWFPTSGSFIP